MLLPFWHTGFPQPVTKPAGLFPAECWKSAPQRSTVGTVRRLCGPLSIFFCWLHTFPASQSEAFPPPRELLLMTCTISGPAGRGKPIFKKLNLVTFKSPKSNLWFPFDSLKHTSSSALQALCDGWNERSWLGLLVFYYTRPISMSRQEVSL